MMQTATWPRVSTSPVTAAVHLTFVITRSQPLSTAEHAVVLDIATRGQRRHWVRVEELDIAGLDGLGHHRLVARLRLRSPDLELRDLPRVAELLDELSAAVPAGRLWAQDPLALFGQRSGRVSCDGQHLLPALESGWHEPVGCRLIGAVPHQTPRVEVSPPATEAELADMLEVVDLNGATSQLIQAGATGALRHLSALRAALFGGTRPGAACRVFATLADRGLANRDALIEGARAVCGDGDVRERASALALLRALQAPAPSPLRGLRPDWNAVPLLGRQILDDPLLGNDAESSKSSATDAGWEDDLDLAELDDQPAASDPLDERIAGLSRDIDLAAAGQLVNLPAFASRAAGRLAADDASATGACLLFHLGLWPHRTIAGWFSLLTDLATGDRPWALRALAMRVLASAGGADATDALITLSQAADPRIAGQAVRALATVPGARARGAVRIATTRADLHATGLKSLGAAHDLAGQSLAEQALASSDRSDRQAAADALVRVAGTRAIVRLESCLRHDSSPGVRRAAAAALARVAPAHRVSELLHHPDIDLICAVLRAVGQAGRAELGPTVCRAAGQPDPDVRLAAATALGTLAIPATTPVLLQLLLDNDVPVGLAALQALRHAGDSRALRMIRLLAAHPGLPGRQAQQVLEQGERLRLSPPDSRVRLRARADHLLSPRSRARTAAAFATTSLKVTVGERNLVGDGSIPPDDLASLGELVRAIAKVDAQEPGLSWSVRDAQGLLRRRDGDWCLSAVDGVLVRDAGWFQAELPHASRPPLTAEIIQLPADPAADGALPIGLNIDELQRYSEENIDENVDEDVDEDVDDDATEQTISGFLEEVTGTGRQPLLALMEASRSTSLEPAPRAAVETAPPPRRAPPVVPVRTGPTSPDAPGARQGWRGPDSEPSEEILFESDADSLLPPA